jgi:hypothetical protein
MALEETGSTGGKMGHHAKRAERGKKGMQNADVLRGKALFRLA